MSDTKARGQTFLLSQGTSVSLEKGVGMEGRESELNPGKTGASHILTQLRLGREGGGEGRGGWWGPDSSTCCPEPPARSGFASSSLYSP